MLWGLDRWNEIRWNEIGEAKGATDKELEPYSKRVRD